MEQIVVHEKEEGVKLKIFKSDDFNIKKPKSDIFGELTNPNIFIFSKKGSGKSNLTSNIIDLLTCKETRLVYFSPTFNQDDTTKETIKYLKN
jgi:hypothetical protein